MAASKINSPQAVKERSPGMMKFVTAHQNHHFASACTEASSACVASASSANIVIIMGAMIMASIFVIIISLLGAIRLSALVMLPMISVVLGMNSQ